MLFKFLTHFFNNIQPYFQNAMQANKNWNGGVECIFYLSLACVYKLYEDSNIAIVWHNPS